MGVTTEQWQKLKNIFAKATEFTGTERQEYVMAACKDNPGLLEEVQSLIEAHDNPGPLDQSLESMKQTALTKIETKNRRGAIMVYHGIRQWNANRPLLQGKSSFH